MKKTKVFIFIHQTILKGGVEKVFYNLLNNLPIEQYDITILSVMGYLDGDFDAELYPKQIKRYCLMWDQFSKSKFFKRILQKIHNRVFPSFFRLYLKFKKYDVAIAAQEGMYADYIYKNVRAKRKLLWIHNDITQCHWSLNYFGSLEAERYCYSHFDKVVCVSNSVKESMLNVFGPMDNLIVCYNPIDTNEIDCKLLEPLPLKQDTSVWFVCVGRLAYQKGYDRLFEVCHKLNLEGYKYNITILGEGEDRELLEKLLRERNIHNIHLIGNQPNPFVYMRQADWLLLPSRHEGFGMVLHEAAYCHTPIVATDVSGVRELLGDSEYGLVVDNSEQAIYEGLKSILENPGLYVKYKEAIIKRSTFVDLKKRISDIQKLIDK